MWCAFARYYYIELLTEDTALRMSDREMVAAAEWQASRAADFYTG